MSKVFNIKGSRLNKFTGGGQEKAEETRKNIQITPALHQMIRDVIIEEETNLKGFVATAIDNYIEEVAGIGEGPVYTKSDAGIVNTTIFLPKELVKVIKRVSRHIKITENELIVRCLVKSLGMMMEKYPHIITGAIKM